MTGACFTDEQRETMYVDALNFYIKSILCDTRYKLVFAENSGWDIERIRRRLLPHNEEQIELLSLQPELFDISKGKGYNEMLILNYALEKSTILASAPGFFKVTGRYPIYNLQRFVDKASRDILQRGKEMYCDIKDHNLYKRLGLNWCSHSFDCRLFAVSADYYRNNLSQLYAECDDYNGQLLEAVLFNHVKTVEANRTLRFDREPQFGGLEGSDINAVSFSKRQDSLKGRFKRLVGNTIRIFMPWFKF